MVGTAARLLVAGLPVGPGGWPWSTFVANVTGSLLLGVLIARTAAAARPTPLLLAFVGTGALGSYTTFSIFSVETLQLVEGGQPLLAAAYVTGSIMTGSLAAFGAIRWVRSRS